MPLSNQSKSNTFTDLASFTHIASASVSTQSSIIKSSRVKLEGSTIIEVLDGHEVEPTVYVRREGDKVVRIEFLCVCGKSTHLDVEYDAE